MPEVYPYTQGTYKIIYSSCPWAVRKFVDFYTTEESNFFYRSNLRQGQVGLLVAFDKTTRHGYNSNHNRVTGDVGMAGVAFDSIDDVRVLFDGIPLDKVSLSMTMNGAVLPVTAVYIRAEV